MIHPKQTDVDYLISQGFSNHQQGKLLEAKACYQQVLNVDPNHFDALQLLGAMACQEADYALAIDLLSQALAIQATAPVVHYNLGMSRANLGMIDEALKNYEIAIALEPNYAQAHNNYGVLLKNLKRLDEALLHFDQAILINPTFTDAHNNRGNTLKALERFDEALSSFSAAIGINPNYIFALINRGNVLHIIGRYQEALVSYEQALSVDPRSSDALNDQGITLIEIGRLDEAVACFKRVIAIKPDMPDAYNNLGSTLCKLHQFSDAIEFYDLAIALDPNCAKAHFNRACALQELNRLDEALESYDLAIHFDCNDAKAHQNRANVLYSLNRLHLALASYDQAIELDPNFGEAYFNRGNLLKDLKRLEEALESYDKAISNSPTSAGAHFNRANVLGGLGRLEESRESYTRAIEITPTYVEARWVRSIAILPIIQRQPAHTQLCRELFQQEINELTQWFAEHHMEDGHRAVGSAQPFYLAYQEENNKEILKKYGELCCELMSHWYQNNVSPSAFKGSNRPIKLGIVSKHIHQHSVWDALTRGWIEYIDRDRVEVCIFYTANHVDLETEYAKSKAKDFVTLDNDLSASVQRILDVQPDVLLYPEIGMDPLTAKLASLRLASVQIASWGHPETTGLPTMDYYLSAELLEPENAQQYYTEKLIKLPNLGCCYQLDQVTDVEIDLVNFNIQKNQPLLICPGVPFKYQPQHDRIFVDIATRLGRCQFIFFMPDGQQLSKLFKARLAAQFLASGLNSDDYCVFLPWQPKAYFYSLMRLADVYLDTIGFSGFNTAAQAIECELPIVTREGKFLRGRLASGLLKRLGLPQLIAKSDDDYVNLVLKLILDPDYAFSVRKTMKEHREVLYNDLESIRALEDFLENACLHH